MDVGTEPEAAMAFPNTILPGTPFCGSNDSDIDPFSLPTSMSKSPRSDGNGIQLLSIAPLNSPVFMAMRISHISSAASNDNR